VRVSRPKNPEFKAFNGGVGVFGVVTELLLQMTPPTNTQLITVVKEDKNMMEEINRLLKVRTDLATTVMMRTTILNVVGEAGAGCQLAAGAAAAVTRGRSSRTPMQHSSVAVPLTATPQ
jgi:hypothetical protein